VILLIFRSAMALVLAVLLTSSAKALLVGDALACQEANSEPAACKGCPPWVADKLRQQDLKRKQYWQPICDRQMREAAERQEAARRQQAIEEAKQKEEAEHRQKLEQERQAAAAAQAIEMSKPINRLRTAYQEYLYIRSCYQVREGYLVVWINDVEMERARQAVTRLEKEILKEDSTLNTDEVWREIRTPSMVYEPNCKLMYSELIRTAPGLPKVKDFGQ